MSFIRYDENGVPKRNRVVLDTGSETLVEQSHKSEVDINNIVRKHGVDLLQQVAALQQFTFDAVPDNDFQEMMNVLLQAKEAFSSVPSDIRRQFDNDPAKFMDFVHNPDNSDKLIEMGLANAPEPPPAPLQVEVVNEVVETPEAPPA